MGIERLFWQKKTGWVKVIEQKEESAASCINIIHSTCDLLEPIEQGAPTGLCDDQGIALLEGDHFTLENSSDIWQVRFSEKHGYVGHFKHTHVEILFSLDDWERVGKLCHRRWLKGITREG